MAKLKGPLFSLGASQQLGKALVFFGWKGLDVVREYVIPANPRTALQTTQRGYLTSAVAAVHASQADATFPLAAVDVAAYALWASVVQAATTWFNQAVKNAVEQLIAGLTVRVWGWGGTTAGVGTLTPSVYEINAVTTAGNFHWGTSRTALIHTQADVPVGRHHVCTIPGLTAGVKYYWQFRPTAPAGVVGANSGIYYGYPT